MELINFIIYSLLYGVLFGISEYLYRIKGIASEHTRKIVHFGSGILALGFPLFFENWISIAMLCSSFLLILIASYKWEFLPSINKVSRVTWGSVLFPIVVFSCFLIADWQHSRLFYFLPLLVLAISDPMAALVGKEWSYMPYKVFGQEKTLMGSIAFFVTALCITILCGWVFEGISVLNMIVIAMACSFAEAISTHGWDNLTIPLASIIVLLLI